MRLRCYDLCCGAGALSEGFRNAGAKILGGIDINRQAIEAVKLNHPEAQWDNLAIESLNAMIVSHRNHPIWKANVFLAGLPCQGFSYAGKRNPHDPRNRLFRHLVDVARTTRPDFVVIENVVGMTAPRNADALCELSEMLRRLGYDVAMRILDAADYGVPQYRKRLFLLAAQHANCDTIFECLRQASEMVTVRQALAGIPGTREIKSFSHAFMDHGAAVRRMMAKLEPGGPISYRKLMWESPARTLVAGHRALPVHPKYPRAISVREAARLQGFHDDYCFYGSNSAQIEQVANAVPPPLATAVARAIQRHPDHQKRIYGKLYRELSRRSDKQTGRRFTRVFRNIFSSGSRTFPWRKNHDPHVVLTTEILLQRTNGELAEQIWRDVIELVPSPAAAERVDLRVLRPLIKRVGIPSRAATIKFLGQTLRERHRGRVPREFDDLLRLPGVGIYIASAVRVFAYEERDFPVDTNAFRFASRYFGVRMKRTKVEARQLRQFMLDIVPSERVSEYVYGFLDFASTICRAKKPLCTQCPLRNSCRSARKRHSLKGG